MWNRLFKRAPREVMDLPEFQELDRSRLPVHTAIIMDGNGRWAKGRELLRTAGHAAGADTVKKILKAAIALELPVLTIYMFSTENWKRPPAEVDFIMRLLFDRLMQEIDEMDEDNVKIRFLGRLDELFPALRELTQKAEDRMKGNTGVQFNVAVNYGGQDEILHAAKSIARRVQQGELSTEDIDGKIFDASLYTEGLPPVDLLIRTGGDMRVSNFLLWQSAYAELWFTDTTWPDFTPLLFVEALKDFGKRNRRFGGLDNK
ncbi:MAG: di-trans,poly-cis-decaprenylcistransferase [Schwartzia sp.]|nr:di-trans,poly-cis-decaprenylcistransferase [Schwartzia sp. (in: firmicutes)]MBR1886283.1 di-trans,poly-cis-decaprenylcistransferase [Schwartzia sp. (in: firmicutes)]